MKVAARARWLTLSLGVVLCSGPGQAACTLPGPRPSPDAIERFLDSPPSFLRTVQLRDVASAIQRYVLADTAVLAKIPQLARVGSDVQAREVGVGLARVAQLCQSRDVNLVRRIENTVRAIDNRVVTLAYRMGTTSSGGDALLDPHSSFGTAPPGGRMGSSRLDGDLSDPGGALSGRAVPGPDALPGADPKPMW